MATFYLDIVSQTPDAGYVRINFGLYAVGDTYGGGLADIRVYDINYGNTSGYGKDILTYRASVPSQTSGSVQIYSNRSLRVAGEGAGVCAVVVEVDYKTSTGATRTYVLKQYLDKSNITLSGSYSGDSFAFGMIGMGLGQSAVSTKIVTGSTYTFVIRDDSPASEYMVELHTDSGLYYEIGTVQGVGLHDVTVPNDVFYLIPAATIVNNVRVVAYRKGTAQSGHFMAEFYLDGNVKPSIGDLHWKDGQGRCWPGDGLVDAFAARISDVLLWADVSGVYGSSIRETRIQLGVYTRYSEGVFTEESPADFLGWTETGTPTVTVTVYDSRGRSAQKKFDGLIRIASYDYPTVSESSVLRWDVAQNVESDESTNVRTHIVGTISSVNGVQLPGKIEVYHSEATEEPDWQLDGTTEIVPTAFEKFVDYSPFSETEAWRFRWVVTDYFGFTVSGEVIIYAAKPIIDVSPDGQSIGFWTTAGGREDTAGSPVNGVYLNGDLTLDEGMTVHSTGGADEGFMDVGELFRPSYNYSSRKFQLDMLQNLALANDRYIAGYNPTGALVRLLGINASGNAELSWPQGGMLGRVRKVIWSGTWSSGSITVTEAPYYNIFLIKFAQSPEHILCFRVMSGSNANMILGAGGSSWQINTGADLSVAGFRATESGTRWMLVGMNRKDVGVGSTWTNLAVERIEGVL